MSLGSRFIPLNSFLIIMSFTWKQKLMGLLAMSRPKPLAALLMAWALGVSAAYGSGIIIPLNDFIWSLLAIVLAGASSHYANEYADWETDALAVRTQYSGGSGVIPSGVVSRSWAMRMALLTLILGLTVCYSRVYLDSISIDVLLVYIIGVLGGWMYSLPPLSFAWRGLGEVVNSFLGGWIAPLYGFLSLSGGFDFWVLISFIPFTLVCFLNLLAVTWPDRVNDAEVGKFTLATQWEPKKLRMLYLLGLMLAYGILVFTIGEIHLGVILAGFLALPMNLYGYTTYTRKIISDEIVYAMVVFAVAQIAAWILIGSGNL